MGDAFDHGRKGRRDVGRGRLLEQTASQSSGGECLAFEMRLLRARDEHILTNVVDGVFDQPVNGVLSSEFLRDPRHHLCVCIENGVVVGFGSAGNRAVCGTEIKPAVRTRRRFGIAYVRPLVAISTRQAARPVDVD
jgi:hypothetical protein